MAIVLEVGVSRDLGLLQEPPPSKLGTRCVG